MKEGEKDFSLDNQNEGENLKNQAEELEKLNLKAENAETEEEKNEVLEQASKLEEEMNKAEKELDLNQEELMNLYESIDREEAIKELAEAVKEAPENVQEEVAAGHTSGFMEWLKQKTMPKTKLAKTVACLFVFTVAMAGAPQFEKSAQAQEGPAASDQLRDNWKEEFKQLKELKEKYPGVVKESLESLENMAKDPDSRLDIYFERKEKQIRFKKLIEKAKEEGKSHLEGYEYDRNEREWKKDKVNIVDEEKLETEEEDEGDDYKKGTISSGKGADPAAW